jgi:uncharacterized LabA/DUF88 family protein
MSETHPQALSCRAIAFVDGQNLFRAAQDCFGYHFPNYDVRLLADRICRSNGWVLVETRFYTGVPDEADDFFWNRFWTAKLAQMGRTQVKVFSRALRYSEKIIQRPDGAAEVERRAREKGVDVRIALDMVHAAHIGWANVLVVFSQDQDLSEAVTEVGDIAANRGGKVQVACAYPYSEVSADPLQPALPNRRGIDGAKWVRIPKSEYDLCIDPRDYRPKRRPTT